MDPKKSKPTHPSYRLHRSQMAWQVIVPVVLAGLILIAVTVLVAVATFRDNGDVDRWAAISTIWLVLPVMFGALIMLVVLAALAYVIGLAAGFIPPYTYKAQVFMSQVEAGAKRGAEYAHSPRTLVPEIGHLIRTGFRRLRGG
jgi:hypothetical protein